MNDSAAKNQKIYTFIFIALIFGVLAAYHSLEIVFYHTEKLNNLRQIQKAEHQQVLLKKRLSELQEFSLIQTKAKKLGLDYVP